MSQDDQNNRPLYLTVTQKIFAKKILQPDEHPPALEITSFQCRKCGKWTSIDHISSAKTIYYCGWCSSTNTIIDKLFTDEQLEEAVELCHDIMASFYSKKKATIIMKRNMDYINS